MNIIKKDKLDKIRVILLIKQSGFSKIYLPNYHLLTPASA